MSENGFKFILSLKIQDKATETWKPSFFQCLSAAAARSQLYRTADFCGSETCGSHSTWVPTTDLPPIVCVRHLPSRHHFLLICEVRLTRVSLFQGWDSMHLKCSELCLVYRMLHKGCYLMKRSNNKLPLIWQAFPEDHVIMAALYIKPKKQLPVWCMSPWETREPEREHEWIKRRQYHQPNYMLE